MLTLINRAMRCVKRVYLEAPREANPRRYRRTVLRVWQAFRAHGCLPIGTMASMSEPETAPCRFCGRVGDTDSCAA